MVFHEGSMMLQMNMLTHKAQLDTERGWQLLPQVKEVMERSQKAIQNASGGTDHRALVLQLIHDVSDVIFNVLIETLEPSWFEFAELAKRITPSRRHR